MRRWGTFVVGMAVGAVVLYVALGYHMIRARDGMHLIPKVSSGLAGTYVDITQFGPADWAKNVDLGLALVQAGRRDLIESAASGALDTGLDRLLGPRKQSR